MVPSIGVRKRIVLQVPNPSNEEPRNGEEVRLKFMKSVRPGFTSLCDHFIGNKIMKAFGICSDFARIERARYNFSRITSTYALCSAGHEKFMTSRSRVAIIQVVNPLLVSTSTDASDPRKIEIFN